MRACVRWLSWNQYIRRAFCARKDINSCMANLSNNIKRAPRSRCAFASIRWLFWFSVFENPFASFQANQRVITNWDSYCLWFVLSAGGRSAKGINRAYGGDEAFRGYHIAHTIHKWKNVFERTCLCTKYCMHSAYIPKKWKSRIDMLTYHRRRAHTQHTKLTILAVI